MSEISAPQSVPKSTPRSNPFSARFLKPGNIGYLFSDEQNVTARELARTFLNSDRSAQIVGPHGSGKSTLVASMMPHLANSFSQVRYIVVRSKRNIVSRLDAEIAEVESGLNPRGELRGELIVIDGIERLPLLSRIALRRYCQRREAGLLVTTHRPLFGLPLLYRTENSLATFKRIVEQIVGEPAGDFRTPTDPSAINNAFDACHGNIREALMELYDVDQSAQDRRPDASAPTTHIRSS